MAPTDFRGILAELRVLGEKPPIEKVEARLRMIAKTVGSADPLAVAALQSALIETLASLKVRRPRALVDAAFRVGRVTTNRGQGRPIVFEVVEPWPEPVDGARLLTELVTTLRRFVVMPDTTADVLALFIVHAHVHDASDISPICGITSPLPNCGKTTLLRFVMALTPRPVATSNCTPSSLFRTIEAHHPTLIADEGDTFLALSDELRGVLNSGHTRDLAKILRNVGDDHEPHEFTTWCPKFLALIGRLPRSLASRAIVLQLSRAKPGEILERLGKRQPRAALGDLPRQLVRWATDHFDTLRAHKSDPPTGLDYRDDDKWSPLLDIADLCRGTWPERARTALRAQVGQDDPEQDEAAVAVLRAVGDFMAEEKVDRMSSAAIITKLTADETSRWVEYGKARKPITQRQLAGLLGGFGVKPGTVRLSSGTPKGYYLADLQDPLSRYTPSSAPIPPVDPPQATQPAPGAAERDSSNPPHGGGVADVKRAPDPHEYWGVAVVADPEGGTGGRRQDEVAPDPDHAPNDQPAPDLSSLHPRSGFQRATPADIEAAVVALRTEVQRRAATGDEIRWEEARALLEMSGLSAIETRRQLSTRAGGDWLVKMLDTAGNPKVLLPLPPPAPDVAQEPDSPDDELRL